MMLIILWISQTLLKKCLLDAQSILNRVTPRCVAEDAPSRWSRTRMRAFFVCFFGCLFFYLFCYDRYDYMFLFFSFICWAAHPHAHLRARTRDVNIRAPSCTIAHTRTHMYLHAHSKLEWLSLLYLYISLVIIVQININYYFYNCYSTPVWDAWELRPGSQQFLIDVLLTQGATVKRLAFSSAATSVQQGPYISVCQLYYTNSTYIYTHAHAQYTYTSTHT